MPSSNNNTADIDSMSSGTYKDDQSIDLQALQKQFEPGFVPDQDENETFSLQTSMSSKTWVKNPTKDKSSIEILANQRRRSS